MVESQPSKLLVAGSIPVSRSTTSAAGSGQRAVNAVRNNGVKGAALFTPTLATNSLPTVDCQLPADKADVAQLAERVLGKDEVTSSILVIGSSFARHISKSWDS